MALIVICVAAVLFVGPVYLIWNYALIDAVTWAKPVGFWEALGIAFLISMLRPSSDRGRQSEGAESKEG
jgi:hypothetical protein